MPQNGHSPMSETIRQQKKKTKENKKDNKNT